MGVKLYRVEPFQHPQENAAFETFCRAAETYLDDLEDVRVVGNLRFSDWQMDVLVLARHSITIVDFKDWSGTITVRRTWPWTNQVGGAVLGGSYVNPFEQVAAYRKRLQKLLSAPVLAGNDFSHINGLVLFTRPIELHEDRDDAIGPVAGKWFHVADWDGAVRVLRSAASEKIDLPSDILDEIVADLKAVPFVPMTGERLVPESAVTDALMEHEVARMADGELEHRDEIRAQYKEAQEGWDRIDFPKAT